MSFSLDDIITLFQGTSLVYSLIIFIIGMVFGFCIAKFLFKERGKTLSEKEKLINKKMESYEKLQSERDAYKTELDEIKSNHDYLIMNRTSQPILTDKGDVHRV